MEVFLAVVIIMAVVATYARLQERLIKKYEEDDCK